MYNIIGTKVVLWKEHYTNDGYADIFGIKHPAYVVDGEFVVTIVETKEVPNMWGDGTGAGWKGTTSDGKIFTCNWNRFPDDSMTPTYYWDVIEESNGDIWQPVDAIRANAFFPHVGKDGTPVYPVHSVLCEKHSERYLEWDNCWKCEAEDIRSKVRM